MNGIRAIGRSEFLTGLAIIATLSGFSVRDAGRSLIAFYKRLKGRKITSESDLTGLFPPDFPIEPAEFIRVFNDPEVQAAMRAAMRPLRREGLEVFQTRVDRIVVETVSKADVIAADAAEMDAIITNEEKVLDIEKASFVDRLAWHLSDHGHPFDAKIEDPTLWEKVAAGDRFGYGDKLHVTLHTEAEREANGRLRIVRTVTKVHRIERPSGEQIDLFG